MKQVTQKTPRVTEIPPGRANDRVLATTFGERRGGAVTKRTSTQPPSMASLNMSPKEPMAGPRLDETLLGSFRLFSGVFLMGDTLT